MRFTLDYHPLNPFRQEMDAMWRSTSPAVKWLYGQIHKHADAHIFGIPVMVSTTMPGDTLDLVNLFSGERVRAVNIGQTQEETE